MKPKITILLLCIFLVILLVVCQVASKVQVEYTTEQLTALISEQQNIKDNAHTMAESARALGWADNDEVIKLAQDKWVDADLKQFQLYEMLRQRTIEDQIRAQEEERARQEAERKKQEEARWNQKAAEYPAATQIWLYMKNLGWNDYVCAGIMGNLMAEVGGQTLDIRYSLSSNGYYGMCQWNKAYKSIWGAGLESQCNFLRDTIEYELNTYGFNYQKGFNFESFKNLQNAQSAALAFAKCYERCGSGSYGVRQSNAVKAYNYFVQ